MFDVRETEHLLTVVYEWPVQVKAMIPWRYTTILTQPQVFGSTLGYSNPHLGASSRGIWVGPTAGMISDGVDSAGVGGVDAAARDEVGGAG
jgi:hypothetical protein